MNHINIYWDGPYTAEDILSGQHLKHLANETEEVCNEQTQKQLRLRYDYGLYMAIGRHPVNGANQLLYIGKTESSFQSRIESHQKYWVADESDEVRYYLGRLAAKKDKPYIGRADDPFSKDWSKAINDAERLVIYYTSPSYNVQELFKLEGFEAEDLSILNYGRRCMLPPILSSLHKKEELKREEMHEAWNFFRWEEK